MNYTNTQFLNNFLTEVPTFFINTGDLKADCETAIKQIQELREKKKVIFEPSDDEPSTKEILNQVI